MAKRSLVGEFVDFVRHDWKWWAVPIGLVLLLLGALLLWAGGPSIAPFLYPLF